MSLTPDGHRSRAFHCWAAEGAVLALPKGAIVYEALNRFQFQQHAACHAINWYKYMFSQGRDFPNGSLYLVTECVKSANWGTAVFYASPTISDYLQLNFEQESCEWESVGKVDARKGPKQKEIVASDDEPNQCVFIRGYKIMLRQDIWDKLKSSFVVGPSQDGDSSSSSMRVSSYSPSHGTSGSQTRSSGASRGDNCNVQDSGHGTKLQASQLTNRCCEFTLT